MWGFTGLSPYGYTIYNTERVCKSGLLIVTATLNDFVKPWTVLIDPGALGKYARHLSLEGSQPYAEALRAQFYYTITVLLVTGTCVTATTIFIDLELKVLD